MSKRNAACGCEISKAIPKGVPFAIIPIWILKSDISPRAKILYALLNSHQNARHNAAFPSRAKLIEEGMGSNSVVDRATVELVKIGAISTKRRFNSSSLYSVHSESCPKASSPLKETPDLVESSPRETPDLVESLLKETPDLVSAISESPEIAEVTTIDGGLIKSMNQSIIFNSNKTVPTRVASDEVSIKETLNDFISRNSFPRLQEVRQL